MIAELAIAYNYRKECSNMNTLLNLGTPSESEVNKYNEEGEAVFSYDRDVDDLLS